MTTKDKEKAEAPWDEPASRADDPAVSNAQTVLGGLFALRKPFQPASIGKLPRATSKDARPGKCSECGGWHKLPAIHLDYVGHAEVTDRLLSVDPEWNWEPLSRDEHGLPRFLLNGSSTPIGLWIKLTVLGVTRLGFGSVEGGAFDPEKQLIGDAIRNAAMRFGVALDLWSKAELESNLEAPVAVDKSTGEVIPMSSRDEGDRMVKEIEAWTVPEPPKQRIVEGIPIHSTKDWKAASTFLLGGNNAYAGMSLGKIIAQDAGDDREALEYFESTAIPAILGLWNRMTPSKKAAGMTVENEMRLLAYKELMDRRSPPPDDTGRTDL